MSNLTGGSIIWNLDVDSSKLSGGLKSVKTEIESTVKDSESKLKSLGKSFSDVGKKMSLAVTAPILAVGGASFKMAADLDDAIGATNQIFKSQSQAMQAWANTIPTYYGIAEGEALTYANTMGAMLQNIGGLTEEQASKQAQTLITLAGDLTAMFGGTTEDAIRALTGSLKGNNTMLDNYGMAVNDAMIKSKAFELGLMKEGDEMSLATKQAATLALITQQTADVTGQANREAGGASGSMRAFQTEVKNLSTQIGQVLLPVITPLIKNLSELVKKFAALSPEQKEMIVKIVGIVAAIGPLLMIIGGAIKLFGTLQTIITVVGGVIAGISAPVLIAIGIIAALIAIGVLLYKNWDTVKEKATQVWNSIANFFTQTIPNAFNGMVNLIKQLPQRIADGLLSLGSSFRNAFSNAWNSLVGEVSQWGGRIWDWGRNIAQSFIDGFKNALNGIGEAFKRTMENAKRFIQGNSPPKEGPLKQIDKWGFNIGEAWVSGFAGSIGKLGSLVNQSLSPLQDVMGYGGLNMAGVDSNGGNTQNVTINGVTVQDKADIDALIRQLGFKLTTI